MTPTLRRPRKARTDDYGKTLETLVTASRPPQVLLVRCPNGVQYIGGGKTFPVKSPVDFMGMAYGKPVMFDAKTTKSPNRLETNDATLKPHQRQMLIDLGKLGAVTGLLCLATAHDWLYWCPWQLLVTPRPSIPWSEMVSLGSVKTAIKWERITSP